MSAHTPGPWYVTGADIHSGAPGTDRWVATVSAGQGDRPTPTDYANARLMAAAPEMLEALRDLHRYITDRDWREELDERAIAATDGNVNAYEEVADRASAAIAKAEGRAK